MPPTDLARLSEALGVVEIEIKELRVDDIRAYGSAWSARVANVERKNLRLDGMVLPLEAGYKIVLNSNRPSRVRFSWAHELGHIILQSGGLTGPRAGRAVRSYKETEDLCDRIAAEILMPKEQFREHMERSHGTLAAVPTLAQIFDASILSTAIRYTDLLTMPAVLSVWKTEADQLKFGWRHANGHCRPYSFGIPKGTRARETGREGPYMAHQTTDVVRTEETLLVSRRSRDGERHNWVRFPTESMGFGSYQNRFVLSLSYVEVPGKRKEN